jgi:WD40 repeat protein
VAFSADGGRVLSGGEDKAVKLWEAATGALIRTFEGHAFPVISVAFSPDSARVASGGNDGGIKLWDAATGALVRPFKGHYGSNVAFSPDGSRLLKGSGKTIKLWDVNTGALMHTFEGHSDWVLSVAFSPVGGRVLSGSADGTVRIWNAETGQVLASLLASRAGEWLAMTPAGFFAASRKGIEMLNIVRGFEVSSVAQFFDHLYRPDLVQEVLKVPSDPEGSTRTRRSASIWKKSSMRVPHRSSSTLRREMRVRATRSV